MSRVVLAGPADFDGWRAAARNLIRQSRPPDEVAWQVEGETGTLLDEPAAPETDFSSSTETAFTVPRAFVALARETVCHSDPERFSLLYRILWRLQHGESRLLELASDPEIHRAETMAKAVRRDAHKMKAFVRFREVETPQGPHFLAWFEPEHFTLEATAPFFVRRFAAMRWSILTAYRSVHWDGAALTLAPGATRQDVPDGDSLEAYWRSYYVSIFNPARLKVEAMRREMPQKYWRNLPEAVEIKPLVAAASRRTEEMIAAPPTLPEKRIGAPMVKKIEPPAEPGSLEEVRQQALGCRRCPLWQPATQTVFGEGPVTARILMVGEQPGDQEDLAGRPFVGPAGQLLDRALAEAEIDRLSVYVTNAVKHFKFEMRGKRRLHKNPDRGEIEACRWWLSREIDLLRPSLIVALGASAARSLLSREVRIGAERGRFLPYGERTRLLVTVHPSYLLRLPDPAAKRSEYQRFVADLRLAANDMRAQPDEGAEALTRAG